MLKKMMFLTITSVLIVIFCFIVFAKSAEKITSCVFYNNANSDITVFNIDGKHCVSIKDVAVILSDTANNFDFTIDDNKTVSIELGKNYSGEDTSFFKTSDDTSRYTTKKFNFNVNKNVYACNVYLIDGEYFIQLQSLGKIIGVNVKYDEVASKLYINKKINSLSDISYNKELLTDAEQIFEKGSIPKVRELVTNALISAYGEENLSDSLKSKINSDDLCSSFEFLDNSLKFKIFTKQIEIDYKDISDYMSDNIKNYAVISMYTGEKEIPKESVWTSAIKVENSINAMVIPKPKKEEKEEIEIDPSKPVVALTFDDGPKKGTTDRLLNILKKYDARATFFVVGQMVEKHPELVKQAYEQGCQIGNHSYSHPILTKLSLDDAKTEINKTSNLVYDATGDYTRIGRPPYGSLSSEIKKASGFEWFNWSIDTYDWKSKNADSVYQRIMSNVGNYDVILMHDLYDSTIDAVERAIPELVEKGYQFVTMKELIELKGGAEKVSGHIRK